MFDLLGYWGGVTLFMWVVLSLPIYLILLTACNVVEWSSRNRISIRRKCDNIIEVYTFYNETLRVVIIVFTCCFWTVYSMFLFAGAFEGKLEQIYSLMQLADVIAMPLSPVLGWVTILSITAGGGALISRKGFDFYFNVKERLDKLTSKASKKL